MSVARFTMGSLADAFRDDMKPKKKIYQSDYTHKVGDRVDVLIKQTGQWLPGVIVGRNLHFVNVKVAGDFEHIVRFNLVRKGASHGQ